MRSALEDERLYCPQCGFFLGATSDAKQSLNISPLTKDNSTLG